MVKVINVTGEAFAANSHISLGGYLGDKIAQLVKARLLSRASQSHRHVLAIEVTLAFDTSIALMDSGGKLAKKTGTGDTMATAMATVAVTGLVFADKTVDATGLLVSSGTTCASGHAVLSDRTAIMLGDALASNAILEVTYLGLKDFGGLV